MRIIQKAILFLSLVLSFQVSSQNYLGVVTSNYAGVMGTDLQPASFVDSRFVVDVNLASFNFNFYNNAMAFDANDLPKWWTKSFMDSTITKVGLQMTLVLQPLWIIIFLKIMMKPQRKF